jgi:hypothetical protein
MRHCAGLGPGAGVDGGGDDGGDGAVPLPLPVLPVPLPPDDPLPVALLPSAASTAGGAGAVPDGAGDALTGDRDAPGEGRDGDGAGVAGRDTVACGLGAADGGGAPCPLSAAYTASVAPTAIAPARSDGTDFRTSGCTCI